MPSVLVELGFLTNAEEEDFLHSDDGKTYMASAIFRAFKEFKEKEDIRRGRKQIEAVKIETPQGEVVKNEPSGAEKKPPMPEVKPENEIVYTEIIKGIRYQIQILSSPKPLDRKSSDFKGLARVDEYKQNGVYKYLAGSTTSYKEARRMQEKLRGMGFKDAFVIAFENGERIDLSKAIAQTTE
jgi:N-acetylmuramoyl-L-alanine amidase